MPYRRRRLSSGRSTIYSSLLQVFLLLLICERPAHGYDIVQRLTRLGVTGIERGQVYRCLRALEQQELVVSAWLTPSGGPARRQYELTASGQEDDLRQSMSEMSRLGRVVSSCLTRWASVAAPSRAPGPP